jgi:hypothetical protein
MYRTCTGIYMYSYLLLVVPSHYTGSNSHWFRLFTYQLSLVLKWKDINHFTYVVPVDLCVV